MDKLRRLAMNPKATNVQQMKDEKEVQKMKDEKEVQKMKDEDDVEEIPRVPFNKMPRIISISTIVKTTQPIKKQKLQKDGSESGNGIWDRRSNRSRFSQVMKQAAVGIKISELPLEEKEKIVKQQIEMKENFSLTKPKKELVSSHKKMISMKRKLENEKPIGVILKNILLNARDGFFSNPRGDFQKFVDNIVETRIHINMIYQLQPRLTLVPQKHRTMLLHDMMYSMQSLEMNSDSSDNSDSDDKTRTQIQKKIKTSKKKKNGRNYVEEPELPQTENKIVKYKKWK